MPLAHDPGHVTPSITKARPLPVDRYVDGLLHQEADSGDQLVGVGAGCLRTSCLLVSAGKGGAPVLDEGHHRFAQLQVGASTDGWCWR